MGPALIAFGLVVVVIVVVALAGKAILEQGWVY
jgi:hypothetical protein